MQPSAPVTRKCSPLTSSHLHNGDCPHDMARADKAAPDISPWLSRTPARGQVPHSVVRGTVPWTCPQPTRRSRSHVLVDGHDLGVELARGPALLVRTEAGA